MARPAGVEPATFGSVDHRAENAPVDYQALASIPNSKLSRNCSTVCDSFPSPAVVLLSIINARLGVAVKAPHPPLTETLFICTSSPWK